MMLRFLLINKLRQYIGYVKYYWVGFVVIIFIPFSIVYFHEFITTFANQYSIVLQILLVILYFYLGLWRKNPIVLISPVSVLFMRGTRLFAIVIATKIFSQLVTYIFTVWIFWLIWSDSFSSLFFVNIAISFGTCNLLLWSRYNTQYRICVYIATVIIESILVFAEPILGIVFNILLITLFLLVRCIVDWAKYLECVISIYKISSVAARFDFVQMQAIVNEKSTRNSYAIPFSGIIIKQPIFAKHIIIDTFRLPLSNWIIMLLFYIVGVGAFMLHLFPQIEFPLFVVMITLSINMCSRQYASNVRILKRKEESGLFLPISNITILLSNILMPTAIIMATNISICILCQLSILSFAITSFGSIVLLIVYIIYSFLYYKRSKITDAVYCSLVMIAYSLWIMSQGISFL